MDSRSPITNPTLGFPCLDGTPRALRFASADEITPKALQLEELPPLPEDVALLDDLPLAPPSLAHFGAAKRNRKRHSIQPYGRKPTAAKRASTFNFDALLDALDEPTPPPLPAYFEKSTCFLSSEPPADILSALEAVFQASENPTDFAVKRDSFQIQGSVRDSGNSKVSFRCSIFTTPWKHLNQPLVLVEFQRRTGCSISYNRFYYSAKAACEPLIARQVDLPDLRKTWLEDDTPAPMILPLLRSQGLACGLIDREASLFLRESCDHSVWSR
eukprot:gb/GEZN01011191.1/.p1 GENE.gb/GEZN01011191.1/~~gb/GEZN01011191.1/.p1  ORF type:complete len:272 (-),score=15.64 gb/GEZN01011191.1/:299-1114(-)